MPDLGLIKAKSFSRVLHTQLRLYTVQTEILGVFRRVPRHQAHLGRVGSAWSVLTWQKLRLPTKLTMSQLMQQQMHAGGHAGGERSPL